MEEACPARARHRRGYPVYLLPPPR